MSDALLDSIVATPGDDEPRLVWADREGGERGELVVVQCKLADPELPRAERYRLRTRERELLRHARAWANLGDLGSGTFVRGFVEHVTISVRVLANRSDELFERAPLTSWLELRETAGNINRHEGPRVHEAWAEKAIELATAIGTLPAGRIVGVSAITVVHEIGDWDGGGATHSYGDAFIGLVAAAPALRGLRELVIHGGQLTETAIPDLARLPALERIAIDHALGGAACVELLRAVPTLTRLALLRGSPPLRGDELATFLAAPEVARLRELDLNRNDLGDEDLIAIANAPLHQLERLGLGFAIAQSAGFSAIVASPQLAGLRELELQGMTHANLGVLASATFAASLRILGVRYVKADHGDVRSLLELPALVSVTGLGNRPAVLVPVIPDVLA